LQADSSGVSIRMFGLDASYKHKALQIRTQAIYAFNKNSEEYNQFGSTDLGKEIFGYYLEASYNLFSTMKTSTQLIPFIRYENFDTQFSVDAGISKNPESHRKVWIGGINFYPTNGLVLKADYQWIKTDLSAQEAKRAFNLGIGYMF
jgi:phosphate-selective porin